MQESGKFGAGKKVYGAEKPAKQQPMKKCPDCGKMGCKCDEPLDKALKGRTTKKPE